MQCTDLLPFNLIRWIVLIVFMCRQIDSFLTEFPSHETDNEMQYNLTELYESVLSQNLLSDAEEYKNAFPEFQLEPLPPSEQVHLNSQSEILRLTTKRLLDLSIDRFGITPKQFAELIARKGYKYFNAEMSEAIFPPRVCADNAYRSFDGSCNNIKNYYWGKSNTAFTRLAPANYDDGIHDLIRSKTGKELPSARLISVRLFSSQQIFSPKFNDIMMAWGQFLTHDITCKIPFQQSGIKIECCVNGLPKASQNYYCIPVSIPDKDEFYSKYKQKCMNVIRSMTIPREDCSLGPTEQLNGCTSYIDGSHIYGKTETDADSLREFMNGRLLANIQNSKDFLPFAGNDSQNLCDMKDQNDVCFRAGDSRVNRNIQLTALHALFLREHNRIAKVLQTLNPHWDDERLYQESRRIVIAELQHITYSEWLPLIIGTEYMQKHNISFLGGSHSTDYNEDIDASIINSFATAALRFFHSTVSDFVGVCPLSKTMQLEKLSENYNRPKLLSNPEKFDDLLRGLLTLPMGGSDPHFSNEVSQKLFRSDNEFGDDLVSIDIQRGRDHGLASYNSYRKLCGLKVATNFEDYLDEISMNNVNILKSLYEDVNDVELFVGGSLEKIPDDSTVGTTFKCILAEQFYRTRVADRYFYDNKLQSYPFTEEQLGEIKKVTLSRIICDNGNDIKEIQLEAFKLISTDSDVLSCQIDIPEINLTAWQSRT